MWKKILVIFSLLGLAFIGFVMLFPSLFEYSCKKRTNAEMESKFQNIYSANVGIITVTRHDDINAYSAGASGVIISKKDDKYYVLTAYHVVKDKDKYLIHTIHSETLSEYRENNPNKPKSSLEDYYNKKLEATLEYTCEESDLAIISFKSNDDLAVMPVSDVFPEKSDKIMVIGNSDGNFFNVTYGKILSNKLKSFETNDGQSKNMVLRHNAYVEEGSSGGAVINDEMKLVGINIGGGTDVFGRFKHGVLIPCDQIQTVINAWEKND